MTRDAFMKLKPFDKVVVRMDAGAGEWNGKLCTVVEPVSPNGTLIRLERAPGITGYAEAKLLELPVNRLEDFPMEVQDDADTHK